MRGLQWFLEAARAVRQKPLLWLSAALALVVAQGAVVMVWIVMLAAAHEQDVSVFADAFAASIMLTPIFLFCSMPLFVAAFSGAARRQFLPHFPGAHPLHRMLHALGFIVLLAALLYSTFVVIVWMYYSDGSSEFFEILCLCLLVVGLFWLAFLILLAQVLAACGTPFLYALARAARAALRPACVVHATAFATGTIAAFAAFAALVMFDSPVPHTWLLVLVCSCAFALDALITPWLMARDMFGTMPETFNEPHA